jgi:hypothetical protein
VIIEFPVALVPSGEGILLDPTTLLSPTTTAPADE